MKHFVVLAALLVLTGCQMTTQSTTDVIDSNFESVPQLTLEEVCKQYPCRENIIVEFRTEGEPFKQQVPLYWPRVFDGTISILPGEAFFIEADLVDGELVNLKEVEVNSKPEKTIKVNFQQMDDSIHMMLSITNPFAGVALKFNMDMIDFDGEAHQTSSCPVLPRGTGFETWPHPIPELVLSNPVAIDVSDMETVTCAY